MLAPRQHISRTRHPRRFLGALLLLAAASVASPLIGCASRREPPLVAPRTLVSPWLETRGEQVWAVVPLRNESGTSVADAEGLSDRLIAAIEETRGLTALPLNRTLAAMRALEMADVRSPADARRLGKALGADAVVVGSVTAWDPYQPSAGLTLVAIDTAHATHASTNPRALQASLVEPGATESQATTGTLPQGILGRVSDHWDGKNHQVQMDVRTFAAGRERLPSALGWRRYLTAMPAFGEFIAYRAVDGLLADAWVASAAIPADPPDPGSPEEAGMVPDRGRPTAGAASERE